MQQAAKYSVTKDDATDAFKVTFTRASYYDIGLITMEHGGVIVWVIIGSALCCLIICMICLWKRCTANKNDDKENFY
jgi:hypothetical protein